MKQRWPGSLFYLVVAAVWWHAAGRLGAETLTFDEVLVQALGQSWDIRIAKADLAVSAHRHEEALARWYPSLSLRAYNGYETIAGQQADPVVVVGDAVSAASRSVYQHSLIAGARFLLYDFGVRERSIALARREVRIRRLALDQRQLDVKNQVLDAYTASLALCLQVAASRRETDLRKEIFRLAELLWQAGILGRYRVEQAGLKLAQAIGRQDSLSTRLSASLARISYLTGSTLTAEGTDLADLAEPPPAPRQVPDAGLLPGVKALANQIAVKQEELAIARRQMLPRVLLQSQYRIFGRDQSRLERSLGDWSRRDATIAVVAEWEFFSGFADVAKLRRLEEEIRRAVLEKQQRQAELEAQIASLYSSSRHHDRQNRALRQRREQIQDNRASLDRLDLEQAMDRIGVLEQDIALSADELEVRLQRIEKAAAAYRLFFFDQGQQHEHGADGA